MILTLHKYLNLPKFEPIADAKTPDEVITDMKLFNRTVRKMNLKDDNGRDMPPADYTRNRADDRYYDYILKLIPELEGHIKEIGFQTIWNSSNHPNGCQLVPHTDLKRGDFCIQWLMTAGGESVKTKWFPSAFHQKLSILVNLWGLQQITKTWLFLGFLCEK